MTFDVLSVLFCFVFFCVFFLGGWWKGMYNTDTYNFGQFCQGLVTATRCSRRGG